jgi:hypothetical protein
LDKIGLNSLAFYLDWKLLSVGNQLFIYQFGRQPRANGLHLDRRALLISIPEMRVKRSCLREPRACNTLHYIIL